MALELKTCVHPTLDLRVLSTRLGAPLGELSVPSDLQQQLQLSAASPFTYDDTVKAAVRDLLRHGGFKPTGRSKPASEYLRQAATKGSLGSINLAVDVCNVVSLHSGLPISVVDLALADGELCVDIAKMGAKYVFNASGQVMDLGGLLCLFDSAGPCANPVKDSQRTKTNASTRETLTLIWGTKALPGRADQALQWYRELLSEHDTQVWSTKDASVAS